MSLTELLPSIHALPRSDKFRLMQELIAGLALQEERNANDNNANREKTPDAISEQNDMDPNLVEIDGHLLFRHIDVVDWTAELQKAREERLASF